MGLLDDLDRRREEAQRHAENSARLAQSFAIFVTQGQGTLVHNKRVRFDTTFIEQPIVTYGSVVNLDDLASLFDLGDSDDAPLPICSGFVTDWDRDDRDFYTGCWVAVRVHYPLILGIGEEEEVTAVPEVPTDAQPEIEHHFTFAGIAMKDIPVDSTDATD